MIVLDASFIVKLVLEEPYSDEAESTVKELVRRGERLVSVDIALSEVLNTLWKHRVLVGDLGEEALEEAVSDLLLLWERLGKVNTFRLGRCSLELAVEHHITVYDALYIAAALEHRAGLATYDDKQSKVAVACGVPIYPS